MGRFVSPPPRKNIKLSDLKVGEKYWIDSSMGGVYTITYIGTLPDEMHQFTNYRRFFHYTDEQIPVCIFVCCNRMTSEEYLAAGGNPTEVF